MKRWRAVALVMLLAGVLRVWAAWQLPVDADEPVYSRAAQDYAQLLRAGDWAGVLHYAGNPEHPPLVKLMYSLPYLWIQPAFGSSLGLRIDRLIAVGWGVLAAGMLALLDPLAGLLLATDSLVIKYTSQVYLESFPLFAALLAILAARKAAEPGAGRAWWWLSAAGLGAAAAGKYLYGLCGIAILGMGCWPRRRSWRAWIGYAVVSGAVFLLLDPAIWLDPLGRLWRSLAFHAGYAQGSLDVLAAHYPWYQAWLWISAPVPWHPQVFFFPTSDILILGGALLGAAWEWRSRRWAVIWAVFYFVVLLVWPTKWPQYTLGLIPALCLLAATGLRQGWAWLKAFASEWNLVEGVLPQPGKIFWITLAGFLLLLTVGKVGYELALAAARSGWSTVTAEVTPLPSNAVHDLKLGRDGRIAIATDGGVAYWAPDERSPWGEAPQVLTAANSGLPDGRVLAMLQDKAGAWWFGTAGGIARWDGGSGGSAWQKWPVADLGLASATVLCLQQDRSGRIWVGSSAGAAVREGSAWRAVTEPAPGPGKQAVFAIAERAEGEQASLWFGTFNGIVRLDEQSGDWSSPGGPGVGVASLAVDRQGRLWAGTLGNGLWAWDGKAWKNYLSSNSQLPLNTVARLAVDKKGALWIGTSYASQPGGLLARLDGSEWQVFTPANSGYGGGEPSAILAGQDGTLWFGTAVGGLQYYLAGDEK